MIHECEGSGHVFKIHRNGFVDQVQSMLLRMKNINTVTHQEQEHKKHPAVNRSTAVNAHVISKDQSVDLQQIYTTLHTSFIRKIHMAKE